MIVEYVVLDKRAEEHPLLEKGEGNAGYDLRALLAGPQLEVGPGETKLIGTGISIYIRDPAFAGFIMARSGLSCKFGLAPANKVGLIDSNYQGELLVALHNHSSEARYISNGERIAQLVILPVVTVDEFVCVNWFGEETERGEGGFGSSGTK